MNTVETRIADLEDAKCIALLGRITFSETFGHLFQEYQDLLDYLDRTFSVQKIENSLKKPNNLFWLSSVNGLPVGYAKLKLNSPSQFNTSPNQCQLQKIYVLKDFLSEGIGRRLQKILLDKAQDLGFETIWLSVLNSNERAIRFYLKSGFENIGSHGFQIGREKFTFTAMQKKL